MSPHETHIKQKAYQTNNNQLVDLPNGTKQLTSSKFERTQPQLT